ncbi:FAS1-like dehydratase domain-containing protein [Nocardioides alcanivorans]|uniref:FAS1-like dehydratase domain-containing protein n=1 Tax=Nocardioides alcanivorans TaxID=2897352 RepID=UPI001F3DF0F2|nr:MaoC family dehydratase N-terminal domain-containing protein [Nocardioides alcanivorans]
MTAVGAGLAVGQVLPARTRPMAVERGRLRFFATAIGETAPRWSDLNAARAAGHPDLPAPPTFLFGLELESFDFFGELEAAGVDIAKILHGGQRFDHLLPVHAGDEISFEGEVTGVESKRGGALTFITRRTRAFRGDDVVAVLTNTLVVTA